MHQVLQFAVSGVIKAGLVKAPSSSGKGRRAAAHLHLKINSTSLLQPKKRHLQHDKESDTCTDAAQDFCGTLIHGFCRVLKKPLPVHTQVCSQQRNM